MKKLTTLLLLLVSVSMFSQMGATLRTAKTPFISTWNTANTYDDNNPMTPPLPLNEITLPLLSTGTYRFTVDWGDGTSSFVTNANRATAATHSYATPGIYTLTISGGINGWAFNGYTEERFKLTEISQWGDLKGAGAYAFYNCENLAVVSATDALNTEGITSFYRQFNGCRALTTLDVSAWDVSQATNFYGQFYNCRALTTLDVSNWDVSQATNFSYQFYSCRAITTLDVTNWDVGSGTNFSNQFSYCEVLTTLDVSAWDVANATNFTGQFGIVVGL